MMVSAGLFFSHSFNPFSQLLLQSVFYPSLNVLSQRHDQCCSLVQLWPASGCLSELAEISLYLTWGSSCFFLTEITLLPIPCHINCNTFYKQNLAHDIRFQDIFSTFLISAGKLAIHKCKMLISFITSIVQASCFNLKSPISNSFF